MSSRVPEGPKAKSSNSRARICPRGRVKHAFIHSHSFPPHFPSGPCYVPGTVPGPKTQAASLGPPSSSPAWRGGHGPILQTRKPSSGRRRPLPQRTQRDGSMPGRWPQSGCHFPHSCCPKRGLGGADLLRIVSPSSVRKSGAWGGAGPPSPDPQGPWAFLSPRCYNPQMQRGWGLTGRGLGHATPRRVSHHLAE